MGGKQSNLKSGRAHEPSHSLDEDLDAAEDTDPDDRAEVVLSRSESEAWGFAWNVAAHAASRLLVAGVDPNSAAGRWNSAQQASSRAQPICRGDELVEVNGVTEHEDMRRELVAADVARLVFRRPEEAEAELAAVAAAAALAKQRRAARARAAAASGEIRVAKRTDKDKDGAQAPPVSVKNTFIHFHGDSDPGDECRGFDSTSLCQEATLSLSDPLPRRSCESPPAEGALSDAESFCSALSRSSAVSQSSGEQRPPSSGGRSCPSTDWEYQVYNDASGRASPRQSPGVQVPAAMVQPIAPAMVPVFVPVLGVQHPFLAMAPMAGVGQMQCCGQAMAGQQNMLHVTVPPTYSSPHSEQPVETAKAVMPKPPKEQMYTAGHVDTGNPHMNEAVGVNAEAREFSNVQLHLKAEANPLPREAEEATNQQPKLEAPSRKKGTDEEARKYSNEQVDLKAEAKSVPKDAEEATTEQPKLDAPSRKKPTRRGGKRARHRPCHVAAAAMEWASASGSIETPSFGDPSSGEEAEGEAESDGIEADVRVGNATMARFMTSVPEARAPKPRSFYPLAARLKVASAGLKPFAGDSRGGESDMPEMRNERTSAHTEFAPLLEEELKNADDENVHTKYFHTEAAREILEEVEPEPASASDLSDPQATAKAAASPPEVAFAVATSSALTRSLPGTVSTATAPVGWPKPCGKEDVSQEIAVGCRVQVVGLKTSQEFNGQWGQVKDFDLELQRFMVQLLPLEGPAVTVKLRRANLRAPRTIALRFEGEEATSGSSASSQTGKWRPTLRSWEQAVDLQ
mmetsp:Transcript_57774/g.102547  ORF Transcript_57774/g.102547 Transcript_57774/m.102547 type:complete len:799 (+) Transcript_57774:138-2534(+)